MALDCLEKLLAALEEHDECDLAHCALKLIDQQGAPLVDQIWPKSTVFAHGLPQWVNGRHVRRAPYDGLLYLTGAMVYQSVSQLLIRRSLFTRIGGFETRWGPLGDRNWEMKAGLIANTIHVPDTWATWRVYPTHASAATSSYSVEHSQSVDEMISDAVAKCESSLAPAVVAGLKNYWLPRSHVMRAYYSRLRAPQSAFRRRLFQASQIFSGKESVRTELIKRLRGAPRWLDRAPGELRQWLESLGFAPVIADASESATGSRTSCSELKVGDGSVGSERHSDSEATRSARNG